MMISILFLLLTLSISTVYLGWRNFEVFEACRYLNNLVYLNNVKNLYSDVPVRYDVNKFPSYNRLLFHVKPILSLVKFPDGFETNFSIETLSIDAMESRITLDSLATVRAYAAMHKVKKNV